MHSGARSSILLRMYAKDRAQVFAATLLNGQVQSRRVMFPCQKGTHHTASKCMHAGHWKLESVDNGAAYALAAALWLADNGLLFRSDPSSAMVSSLQ